MRPTESGLVAQKDAQIARMQHVIDGVIVWRNSDQCSGNVPTWLHPSALRPDERLVKLIDDYLADQHAPDCPGKEESDEAL